jgi:hypothetical protein
MLHSFRHPDTTRDAIGEACLCFCENATFTCIALLPVHMQCLSSALDVQVFRAAREKEERMRKIISSLVTLASASGVSQERALFMEVAKDEVDRMIDKMNRRGGAPFAL